MSLPQWNVPLSDIDFDAAELQAVTDVLRSGWLSMGEVTARFEQRFAELLGLPQSIAVANGTAALHLACLALDLGPGDEVIVPALTFVATANAVLYSGARPVFADILSPDDLTIAPEAIEASITPHTRAIAVMHYGGYLCDMPAILALAERHNLAVIEDAAHAPGAQLDGQAAGTFGALGCFSFFSNKNLVTGEGGLVAARDPGLNERLRRLRSHGMTSLTWDRHRGHASSYDVVALGYNYRMDEIHAALGLVQLEKLAANNQRRRELSAAYRTVLADNPWLELPFSQPRGLPACHLFVSLLREPALRPAFLEHLKRLGIQTSLHYPPIHRFSYYQARFSASLPSLPQTEAAAARLVSLPLFPSMRPEQFQAVVDAIASFRP